ncbi:hypothetical protein [Rubritalea profundi]|uniref:Uncharacterized protein n=1 Tax=Rubritalea profundi TaxID=1658618 RepID=A0A2S7U1X0_9BACT|nr:hypothetical protein [Rubritalea profundi]PQJ28600.1 hypothetical protein BSZ32_08855 [Rubritalea profundi]
MISRRKQQYPVGNSLHQYLYHFGRHSNIPQVYDDLLRFVGAMPYEDPTGHETLWLTVMYPPEEQKKLSEDLISIYTALKIGSDTPLHEHLTVDRIDFGEFGNSRPFRIKITNQFNDNSDYFYVKIADSSRIFGLELEHILSPNRINYLVNGNTLIEDHIAGVPGDAFLRDYLDNPELNKVRIAKEFTKFNERCFIRLLGDMRSVNYVVDITPDFEEVQYRVRPIDFDQQSYEGQGRIYLSYNFRSNRKITKLSFDSLNRQTISQYAEEERSQMARRAASERRRLSAILKIMKRSEICPDVHVDTLGRELDIMHKIDKFKHITTMGEMTAEHICHVLNMPDLKY